MSEGASKAAAPSFDAAALNELYAAVSQEDGIEIEALDAKLKGLFALPRSDLDLQAYREGKKPWKKLADEVAPVAQLLRQLGTQGCVRFPLDDQPPDAWLMEGGVGDAVGIEVTRVLGRSKMELAKDLRDKPIGRGFQTVSEHAQQKDFEAARARGRVINVRSTIEAAIEESARERLQGKSAAKFKGFTLLLLAPLGSLPDHDWSEVRARLALEAEATVFGRIILMDDQRPSKPPIILVP